MPKIVADRIERMKNLAKEKAEETYEATEFEYNGHSYIWFKARTWKANNIIGIVHNPDCECNNIK